MRVYAHLCNNKPFLLFDVCNFLLLQNVLLFLFQNFFDHHFWSRSNLLRNFNATIISLFGSTSKNVFDFATENGNTTKRTHFERNKKNTKSKQNYRKCCFFFSCSPSLSLPSNSSAHCFTCCV